jgi:AmmeMemoRadiSam system protein B
VSTFEIRGSSQSVNCKSKIKNQKSKIENQKSRRGDLMSALFSGRSRSEVRAPVVAGTFYPGSASSLKAMINDFMANAEKRPINGDLVALIVPHAGYVYSGQVAASAYKQIEGMHFDTVVLAGVSHRSAIRGASVYRSGSYETPLGSVEIDSDLAGELLAQGAIFSFQPGAHAMEHSLEVQIPFLQQVLSDFKIVPILMGHWSESVCSAVGDALAKAISSRNILLIASSDMSHYHPYDAACRMDNIAISDIKLMDTANLMDNLSSGKCELCGAAPVIAILMTAKQVGADGIEILQYANSGDVTGDKSGGVVGYFAAAVYRSK